MICSFETPLLMLAVSRSMRDTVATTSTNCTIQYTAAATNIATDTPAATFSCVLTAAKGYFSVWSEPSFGAPVPDEPMNSLRPSGNVTSRPFARHSGLHSASFDW